MNLEDIYNTFKDSKEIVFDIETTDLHHKLMDIDGIAFCSEIVEPIYIDFHKYDRFELSSFIKKLFSLDALFIGHNLQFDIKVLAYFFNVRPEKRFDTLTAVWYLDENKKKDLKHLGREVLGMDMKSYKDEVKEAEKKEKELWGGDYDKEYWLAEYCKKDVKATYGIYKLVKPKIDKLFPKLFYEIEMPFIDVLVDITLAGFDIDKDYLDKMETYFENKKVKLTKQIHDKMGEFNINSSQQLSEKIYGLEVERKDGKTIVNDVRNEGKYPDPVFYTDKGAPSTSVESLEKLGTKEANLILEYRKTCKLVDTYAKGYKKFIIDGKIYPNFGHNTVTGRLCVHPDTLIEAPRNLGKYPNRIPLRDIKVGDLVYSFDCNKKLCLKKVKWVGPTQTKPTLKIYTDEGFPIILSRDHLVRKFNGYWVHAKDLKVGDRLLCIPSRKHKVTKIEDGPETLLWDLEVEDTHTFIGNDIALHNSSSSPNFQNLPKEPTDDYFIRDAFICRDGYNLIVADESQLELRILAYFSQDEKLIKAYQNREDVHELTASKIFNKEEGITEDERYKAKRINFAIIYGMGPGSLAQLLKVSENKAKMFLNQYFKVYPKIEEFMNDSIIKMKRDGYVTTLVGRRRRIPEINSPVFEFQKRAERQIPNSRIQGSASDILKIAMLKIWRQFKKEDLDAKILSQIHDEIVCRVSEEDTERAKEIIKYYMEHPFKKELTVPLEVEPMVCQKWGEGK